MSFNKKHWSTYIILIFLFISCGSHKRLTEKDLMKHSTIENLDKFGAFIWSKKDDGTIAINTRNLNRIKRKSKKDPSWFISLVQYNDFIINNLRYKIKNISFAQQSCIVAYIINYQYQIQPVLAKDAPFKNIALIKYLLDNDENRAYDKEFRKNNFYNLPVLKEKYIKEYRPPLSKKELPPSIIKSSDMK